MGTWTFEGGGFVVDGGHRRERVSGPGTGARGAGAAPLLGRFPVPPEWRCVIALPDVEAGLSGEEERAAFARLTPPPAETVWRMAHLLLLGVLPALVERDIVTFGRRLSELQRRVGECFRPIQGSMYAAPEVGDLVRRFEDAGAAGAGQSSWGPAVFAVVGGEEAAAELAERARGWIGASRPVFTTAFDNAGASLS
ncbi:MAG: hypothetical protein H0V09_00810 [Gemmatimonadetes bacterium]|nr:hypothetical protein [Gemmatimonadota bacterium]